MGNSYEIENGVLKAVDLQSATVTIPSEVVKIGKGAFEGSQVTSVVFAGNKLKIIDDNAFRNCTHLKNIMIPEGVVQIGDNAFYGCSSLEYIEIPESVVIVCDDILGNCNDSLFIIGKANTEAENVANQYHLTLRSDRTYAISAHERSSAAKSNIKTETFDIFGESVTVSNSLSKYHSNLEYYSSRKEPVFRDFSAKIPTTLYDNFGGMRNILENEEKNVITRLSYQGVFVKQNALTTYLLQPYEAIVTAYESIKDVYDTLVEEVKTGISNKKDELIREAENKVTGLSYGMIGSSFDLALYSIDDYRERTRQRKEAYAVAKEKATEFIKQQHSEGNKMYSDFVAKALPYLRQGIDSFIDALCKAENDLLTKAGLLDENIESTTDTLKSSQWVSRISDKDEDNSLAIAMALKYYPCNIAALTYAAEHGYESQGLTDLIHFLGLEAKIQQVIEAREQARREKIEAQEQARREKKLSDLRSMISSASVSFNYVVHAIKCEEYLLKERDIRALLATFADKLTPKIEEILNCPKLDSITNVSEYCSTELMKVIGQDRWEFFQKYSVQPIKSDIIPVTAATDYSKLKDWLCAQLDLKIKKAEQEYSQAKEILGNAKTISDYKEAAAQFRSLGNYKDSEILCQNAEAYAKAKKRTKKVRRAIITASIVCVFAALGIFGITNIANGKYNDAIALMNDGKSDEAYSIFIQLRNYKDAADKASDIRLAKAKEQFKDLKAGDYINFGTYEQDNILSNGKEDIVWFVLEVKDGKALVISKQALTSKEYHKRYDSVSWETCTLRKWLNGNFINSAFSTEEKAMIPTRIVPIEKTQDQVFLLSKDEVDEYKLGRCTPTDYAVAKGAELTKGSCPWWLRSRGNYPNEAAYVSWDGTFWKKSAPVAADSSKHSYNSNQFGVRPAMWIDLNA